VRPPRIQDEPRAIATWLKERARLKPPYSVKTFFVSERRRPLHRSTVNLLLDKYSSAASLPLRAHPHMLRHGCGFALADQGADTRLIQDYLGHRNIQHTFRSGTRRTIRRDSSGSGSEWEYTPPVQLIKPESAVGKLHEST
jgi:integrase